MKKKKNAIKRNSGFIIGCLLAAGASYFTADVVMTQGLPEKLTMPAEGESEEVGTGTVETVAPETNENRVFETDSFTVTASGNIIKGVETEPPVQTEAKTESPETDENGNPIESTDGNDSGANGSYSDGNYDNGSYYDNSSYYGDGYYDDGSYYGGGYYDDGSYDGSYGQPIEIQDPGNGSYSYDGGNSSGGSGSGDVQIDSSPAVTPSDVIIQGISSRYIDESELYNYDAAQLRLIRNEIFALHGRIFNSQDLRDYFSQKSWYVPTYAPDDFDANMFYYLNDYEAANLKVILNYEAALAGY